MATTAQRLRDLATDIGTRIKGVRTLINGNVSTLDALKTQTKTHLVAAINEVKDTADSKQASLGFTPENVNNKGQAGGYASLDGAGKVPAIQLPSYVDDVLEFPNLAGFPAQGETGKVYIADDTDRQYRWSGTGYRIISASPGSSDAVTEGQVNLYFTKARAQAAAQEIYGDPDVDLVALFEAALT